MYNVLIIDDEPWAREVVKSLGNWEAMRLRVVGEAEDGREGLRCIAELAPHIVITDMRMPGVDGMELLKRITEEFPSIKMIVMSGYDDFVYLKQAISSRAVDYLLKPLDETELNEALRKCALELDARRWTIDGTPKAPLVFPSDAMADRYAALRQRVFASLFELDVPGVFQAFERLSGFIASSMPEGIDDETKERIREDFVGLLERFLSEHHELAFSEIFEEEETAISKDSLLQELSLLYSKAADRVESRKKSKARLKIDEVASYVENHYGDPISLETIAHQFYVSKEHLSRAFKSATGENLSEFILRIRMEKAKELLAKSEISIKHAARLTGFPEVPHFHRVFKKRCGLTPGEYKQRYEK